MTAYLLTDEPCPRCLNHRCGLVDYTPDRVYCELCAGTGRRLVTLDEALTAPTPAQAKATAPQSHWDDCDLPPAGGC